MEPDGRAYLSEASLPDHGDQLEIVDTQGTLYQTKRQHGEQTGMP